MKKYNSKKIKSRASKQKKISINTTLIKSIKLFFIIFVGFVIIRQIFISSPLFYSKNSINEISSCKPKTICTRKVDGRKDCTTYECPTIVNGTKITNIKSEIISDTAGTKKVVETSYEVKKVAPVNSSGVQTGNSTTIEVRKKIDPDSKKEEVVSTVTTVQEPPKTNESGQPVSAGKVVLETRTGDISLGVTNYSQGKKDEHAECLKDSTKTWENDKCVPKRSAEKVCTENLDGSLTGNVWLNGVCTMKKIISERPSERPLISNSTNTNCDVGSCNTTGNPVCFGSYVMTGSGFKDGKKSTEPNSGDRECTKCGFNGTGGVGYTGESVSCKDLIKTGAPVVLGVDVDPQSLGLSKDIKTAPCMARKGDKWVLVPVGEKGDGPNEGKYCTVSGNWSDIAPQLATKTSEKSQNLSKNSTVVLSPEANCHAQHPGFIFGRNFDGKEVCLPNTAMNQSIINNSNPCVRGMSELAGRKVYIECSSTGSPSYRFCSTPGGFDENGNCIGIQNSISENTLSNTPAVGFSEFYEAHPIRTAISMGVGAVPGCLAGVALMAPIAPVGCVVGGVVGAGAGGAVGNFVSNTQDVLLSDETTGPREFYEAHPIRTAISMGVGAVPGCLAGVALMAPIAPVGCAIGGFIGGSAGGMLGNFVSNTQDVLLSDETTGPREFYEAHPIRTAISMGVGAVPGCLAGVALMAPIAPVGCAIGGFIGGSAGGMLGNFVSNVQDNIFPIGQ